MMMVTCAQIPKPQAKKKTKNYTKRKFTKNNTDETENNATEIDNKNVHGKSIVW